MGVLTVLPVVGICCWRKDVGQVDQPLQWDDLVLWGPSAPLEDGANGPFSTRSEWGSDPVGDEGGVARG